MKIRSLIMSGLMVVGCAAMAQAQPGWYGERRDIGRDLRQRDELMRRIDADRRAVAHERMESRNSGWYGARHEFREMRAAQERLDCDLRELNALNRDLNHDVNRYPRY